MELSDLETALLVVMVIFAVIGLVVVAVLAFLAIRYRPSLASIAALAGALIYAGSPVDLIPELFVGPIGAIDDVGVLVAAIAFMVDQMRKRRQGRPVASGGVGTRGTGGTRGNGPVIIRQLPDE